MSAIVVDILDGLGLMHQAMRHDIRPLHPDFIVVGRARTLIWIFADVVATVVVPQDLADEAINKAWEKVNGENKVRDALRAG
jgi:regulator of RNase E activity RraA